MISLAAIVQHTGVSNRRLRYVLEHGLIEFDERVAAGRGVPRQFDLPTATTLAVAGLMLDAGLRRSAVITVAWLLRQVPLWPASSEFDSFGQFSGDWVHRLDVAEGQYYRWTYRSLDGRWKGITNWVLIPPPEIYEDEVKVFEHAVRAEERGIRIPAEDYAPLVTVSIDVEAVRRTLRKADAQAS